MTKIIEAVAPLLSSPGYAAVLLCVTLTACTSYPEEEWIYLQCDCECTLYDIENMPYPGETSHCFENPTEADCAAACDGMAYDLNTMDPFVRRQRHGIAETATVACSDGQVTHMQETCPDIYGGGTGPLTERHVSRALPSSMNGNLDVGQSSVEISFDGDTWGATPDSGAISIIIPDGPSTAGDVHIEDLRFDVDDASSSNYTIEDVWVVLNEMTTGSITSGDVVSLPAGLELIGGGEVESNVTSDVYTAASAVTGTMNWSASPIELTIEGEVENSEETISVEFELVFLFSGGSVYLPIPNIDITFDPGTGNGDGSISGDLSESDLGVAYAWYGENVANQEWELIDGDAFLELDESEADDYSAVVVYVEDSDGQYVTEDVECWYASCPEP